MSWISLAVHCLSRLRCQAVFSAIDTSVLGIARTNARADCSTDGAKRFRIIILAADDVRLIEYLVRLFQAGAMFSLDAPALLLVELEAHRYTYLYIALATLAASLRSTWLICRFKPSTQSSHYPAGPREGAA
jgi:hypothetical protein